MSRFSCGPRYYRKPVEWIFSITLQLPERRQRRLNGHDRAGKVKGSMLEVDNLWDVISNGTDPPGEYVLDCAKDSGTDSSMMALHAARKYSGAKAASSADVWCSAETYRVATSKSGVGFLKASLSDWK
ncbi:hypothetical protein SNOG_10830 [Parastagonospora nodorum SN15]|uniref:Uncharacterized protein n=1 Tax=Phaeosphaeria nodorum (strain SN15 / ATCC MYA-4574 / FGSC 10173) TaxID=321614 RepID=Q0UBN4_PHANO|nr:hypothetical protein SNOG_10830 [Parastagonospora nodorum SN15]EAT82224.1 hypothetical protein SNOG_10830 [Parastagonospora nodorum SN15]